MNRFHPCNFESPRPAGWWLGAGFLALCLLGFALGVWSGLHAERGAQIMSPDALQPPSTLWRR